MIDEGFKFRLYVIGDGIERNELYNMICENQLQDSLILVGKKNNPYPYMLKSDFTLLVSYYEGMPTVVSESLILKKPVFSTKVAGIDYLLKNGEYGIIVDNCSEAIYEQLKNVLKNINIIKKYEKKLKNYNSKNSEKIDAFCSLIK